MPAEIKAEMVYLTTSEAAERLRLSARTMEGMRLKNSGPPYIRLGDSGKARVLYRLADVDAWANAHIVSNGRWRSKPDI